MPEAFPSHPSFSSESEQLQASAASLPEVESTYPDDLERASKELDEIFRGVIEKMCSTDRARELRLKLTSNCIHDEEYLELRQIMLSSFQELHPPLNQPFDPRAELNRIRQLPSEQRMEQLEKYKTTRETQRAALAQCLEMLTGDLNYNPELDESHLLHVVEVFRGLYGFSDEQTLKFQLGISLYQDRHRLTIEARNAFPDNEMLATQLLGQPVDEAQIIDISTSALSIDILLTQEGYQSIPDLKGTVGAHGRIFLKEIDGVISYTVRYPHGDLSKNHHHTLRHEQQHAINRITQPILDLSQEYSQNVFGIDTMLLKTCQELPDEVEKEKALVNCMKIEVRHWQRQAKDEILSQLQSNLQSYMSKNDLIQDLKDTFLTNPNKYDYPGMFADCNNIYQDAILGKVFYEAYSRDYLAVIHRAIESLAELEGFISAQHENNQLARKSSIAHIDYIIATLTISELREWPNAVRRITSST